MRAKHGGYDETRHLPTNSGKLDSSGLYAWLRNNIAYRFDDGADLVAQCHKHGVERYTWPLRQLFASAGVVRGLT